MNQRIIPLLVLVALPIMVFLPHLTGYGVFVGDSDRMNHSLTAFAAFLHGFTEGHLPLWNESQFAGYSLISLPYYYPNPIVFLAALLHVQDVYFFAGFEAATLFFLAGLAAYVFLRSCGRSWLAALVGGVLYPTCALSVEKVSQNDLSFIVIILIPVLIGLLRCAAVKCTSWLYLGLFLTIAALLNFTFLQKVAYALLFAGLYTIWLAACRRNWRPILFSLAAGIPALILSIPRLITVGQDFAESNRTAETAKSISAVYDGAGFSRIEILRWFDERIFGSTFENMTALGQFFNLHEGFLLYLTSFAPFLLIYLLIARIPFRRNDIDAQFFVYFTLLCFFFTFTGTGYWLLWTIFFRIDFLHLRVLVVAILPCCALLALFVDDLHDKMAKRPAGAFPFRANFVVAGAVAYAVFVEIIALYLNSREVGVPVGGGRYLDGGACFRIASSAFALGFLGWMARQQISTRHIPSALATLLIVQGMAYAALTVWGPQHWPMPPTFTTSTRLMARPGDYRAPSREAVESIRIRLEADRYRTVFVCPPREVAIFCSPQIANLWKLRSIDGYISSVPQRLAALPLGLALSQRSIEFTNIKQIDWALVGLFNVKYALMFRPELFTDAVRQPGKLSRELMASDLLIVPNPMPVAPRLFFARKVVAQPDMQSAVRYLFLQSSDIRPGYKPEEQSVVEGLSADRAFSVDGSAAARFAGDTVTVELSPSMQERFLVLNERYEQNWVATDDTGANPAILPTNVAMRGVIVPAGVRRIVFAYKPFAVRAAAVPFYFIGFLLAAGGMIGFAFHQHQGKSQTSAPCPG